MDERLTLAAAMYAPCEVGADIGTDHGLLPCHLLRAGICRRMILADVSDLALNKARAQVARQHLTDRARIVCADGLDALTEPVGCVSITGMGGETMADILRTGADKLCGAVLVLSAYTDLHLVRKAVMDVGYHFTQERLCRAAGRFYLVWRAEQGQVAYTEDELALGTSLLTAGSDLLLPDYLAWRLRVTQRKLDGLRTASQPDAAAIARLEHHIDLLRRYLPC
ncbi:MAG: SAM-dependent methyltransferase [Clostridia bacterium]|nr:SAM-dependent methyltransferase [Clostridia bacterium]